MPSIIINLLGSPSSGKSTLACRLFAKLKDMNMNVEYTPEYVKSMVWSGKKINPYDQITITGAEVQQQSRLFNKVDFIISDSPVLLTAFYHKYYNKDNALREICKDFYDMAYKLDGVRTLNIFLPRKKGYQTEGRYQTEEEANEVARMLKQWLEVEGYPFIELGCPDEDRVGEIIKLLSDMTEGFKDVGKN